MSLQHAVVWLDHHRAVVIDFSRDAEHVHIVPSSTEQRQIHRRSGGTGQKVADDRQFFDDVVAAIGDAREILVVGPGSARTEFKKDLDKRYPKVAALVVGVEPADHPSVDDLLASARKYFKRVDALRGSA
jgi:stalled ribosome rescue protein Dom34